jgi:hypothetical protein
VEHFKVHLNDGIPVRLSFCCRHFDRKVKTLMDAEHPPAEEEEEGVCVCVCVCVCARVCVFLYIYIFLYMCVCFPSVDASSV